MSDGINAGVVELANWRVLAVKDKGLYVAGDGDPWLVASHEQLQSRDDELSLAYESAIDE